MSSKEKLKSYKVETGIPYVESSFIVKQLIDQCGLLVFPLIFEEIT